MTNAPEQSVNAGSDVVVRVARPEDREFVHELAVEVFTVYGSYGRYLTQWFDSEEIGTWIAEKDKAAVGLIMIGVKPHPKLLQKAVADLLAIAVKPTHQAKGIGKVLLHHALEIAPRLPSPFPVVEMHLSVAESNSRAQRLFSRQGFRMISGEGVYPAGQRAFHMAKKLQTADGFQEGGQ
jgi:ribosomal protein S18 acetylase RimI-like enzyme